MDELFANLQQACAAAGIPVPEDPLTLDLANLDQLVPDKSLRGKVKAALVRYRRAAAAAAEDPASAPSPAAPQPADGSPASFAPPAGSPADLWLLTPDGWQKLGTATRQPTANDELGQAAPASGTVQRITSTLVLEGEFSVPEDLYNTCCYLAHEGLIYRAYYLSHVGDVKRGTHTAYLKVDSTCRQEGFARAFSALGKAPRPTGDEARRQRFGEAYETDRRMFAQPDARLA